MAYSLARWPDARDKVKEELATQLTDNASLTFSSIRDLPYTYAFLKEVLRCACHLCVTPGAKHTLQWVC